MFRFRVVRQRVVGPAGHRRDERVPDRHQAAQGAAEEGQRRIQALLAKETASRTRTLRTYVYNSPTHPPAQCQCLVPISGFHLAAIYTNCEIFLLVNCGADPPLVN